VSKKLDIVLGCLTGNIPARDLPSNYVDIAKEIVNKISITTSPLDELEKIKKKYYELLGEVQNSDDCCDRSFETI